MARPRHLAACVPLVALVVVATSGCSGDDGSPEPDEAPSAALRVETVSGAGTLPEIVRNDLETRVGDVLSHYLVGAFLGDFPRRDFVSSFEGFTSGAARHAAQDIDLLTAAPVQDADSVRATRLVSRLSFLVDSDVVVGATAAVDFAFEADMGGGETRDVTLRGRFMLMLEDGTWSVFGYDVAQDDGAPLVEGGTQ